MRLIYLRYNVLYRKLISDVVYALRHRPSGAKRLFWKVLNEKFMLIFCWEGGKTSLSVDSLSFVSFFISEHLTNIA